MKSLSKKRQRKKGFKINKSFERSERQRIQKRRELTQLVPKSCNEEDFKSFVRCTTSYFVRINAYKFGIMVYDTVNIQRL